MHPNKPRDEIVISSVELKSSSKFSLGIKEIITVKFHPELELLPSLTH